MPAPPIERDLAHSDLTDRIGHAVALRHQDLDLPSFVTISSGLYRFLDIRVLLLAQAQLQDGPLLEGWIAFADISSSVRGLPLHPTKAGPGGPPA